MTGRPLKFKSVEELKGKIEDYFNSCFRPLINKSKDIVRDDSGKAMMEQYKPFTIAGLAYHLGTCRQTLLNYQAKNDEFFDTVSRAKERCEAFAAESLFSRDGSNGAKFVLINGYEGWKDKQTFEGDVTHKFEDILDELE